MSAQSAAARAAKGEAGAEVVAPSPHSLPSPPRPPRARPGADPGDAVEEARPSKSMDSHPCGEERQRPMACEGVGRSRT